MKQAILIMCHNEYYILEKLIELIDYPLIDIYIHVDIKWKNFPFERLKNIVKKGKIFFTDERLDVKWGEYSQVECEMILLKQASKKKYKYYHLISGVDLPLQRIENIFRYFNNQKEEFVAFESFDYIREDLKERIKEPVDFQLRKGANWFSITNNLVNFILSNEQAIKDIFSNGYCVDEMFIQTLVYNSTFINNVHKECEDEHLNIKRCIDWKRGNPYIFKIDDFDNLINSGAFFARKFSTNVDKEIIDKIYEYLT